VWIEKNLFLFIWEDFVMLLEYFDKKTVSNFLSPYCVQKYCVWRPPKALFTRDILTHNIAIKRYCDKKTFFIQYFFSCVNWKYLFYDNYAYCNLVWKDFKVQLQYFDQKKCLIVFLSQYLFIAISQYCVQKYCVWIRLSKKDIFEQNCTSLKKPCKKYVLYCKIKTITSIGIWGHIT